MFYKKNNTALFSVKKISYLFFATALAITFGSCDKDEDPKPRKKSPPYNWLPALRSALTW